MQEGAGPPDRGATLAVLRDLVEEDAARGTTLRSRRPDHGEPVRTGQVLERRERRVVMVSPEGDRRELVADDVRPGGGLHQPGEGVETGGGVAAVARDASKRLRVGEPPERRRADRLVQRGSRHLQQDPGVVEPHQSLQTCGLIRALERHRQEHPGGLLPHLGVGVVPRQPGDDGRVTQMPDGGAPNLRVLVLPAGVRPEAFEKSHGVMLR